MLRQLENELTETRLTLKSQENYIIELELQKAKYKALFYGKNDLAEKLNSQLASNLVYYNNDSIDNMLFKGDLTQDDYDFCCIE